MLIHNFFLKNEGRLNFGGEYESAKDEQKYRDVVVQFQHTSRKEADGKWHPKEGTRSCYITNQKYGK